MHRLIEARTHAGGSCISVSDAVRGCHTHVEPFANFNPLMSLGSPAVTQTSLGWLPQSIDQCKNCTIDFVNIHWYGSSADVDSFKRYIDEAQRVAHGRPIWITEFRASGSDQDVIQFLETVMPWMDNSSDIHR
jgi:hypothetical protein